jgi:glycosyltransferase involved in cell wall biosynthesis
MKSSDLHRDLVAVNAAVVIPAYNASSTIGETLDALQNNPGLSRIKAVIILDDCSRDGTVDAAKSAWRSSVPLEVWSNGGNAGQWSTTNAGLAGLPDEIEWAFVLHADDVVKPNWIALYFNEMISCSDEVASICSSYDNWFPDSNQVEPGEEKPDCQHVLVYGTRETVLDTLQRGCWWHISGCAIRTRAFREIGSFECRMPYSADWEWLLRCLAKGFSVLYLPRSTMLYRRHTRSVSSNSFRQAQDLRETLQILSAYRDQGYLTRMEYRRNVKALLRHLSRRTLVRAMRCDMRGVRHHTSLLTGTLARYVLGQI